MENSLTTQFQAALGQISHLEEPKSREEVGQQLAYVAEAVSICEKILIYLATTEEGRGEMLDYLFQYKQLVNAEKQLQDKKLQFPVEKPLPVIPQKKWKRGQFSVYLAELIHKLFS